MLLGAPGGKVHGQTAGKCGCGHANVSFIKVYYYQHALTNHHMPLTREELGNNTKILLSESNNNKLSITEALLTQKMQPSINTQSTGISRTLKLFA